MKKNRQAAENTSINTVLKPIITSSFVGVVITAAILLALSFMLSVKDLPHAAIEPLALMAGIVGSMASGFICARLVRKNGLLLGGICGLINFSLLAVAGYVTAKSGMDVGSFYKAIIFILSGAIGGVLGVNAKRKIK